MFDFGKYIFLFGDNFIYSPLTTSKPTLMKFDISQMFLAINPDHFDGSTI